MNKILFFIIGINICLSLEGQIKITSYKISDNFTQDTVFYECLKELNITSKEKDLVFKYQNESDLCIYVNAFIKVMNNKVNSLMFSKALNYSDLAIEGKNDRIVIHELIFKDSETVDSILSSLKTTNNNRLPTEALIYFKYFGISNRLIIFTTPRKEYFNKYNKYIEGLEHIYMLILHRTECI